jgi:peptide-methionine (S)-S-oxide reductase
MNNLRVSRANGTRLHTFAFAKNKFLSPFEVYDGEGGVMSQTSCKVLVLLFLTVSQFGMTAPKKDVATLSGGCFWGMEEYFRKIPGVIGTRVGYTGGTLKNPSYEDVSSGKTGHAESVEITFDPKKINYEELLYHFFRMHDPTTLNAQGNDIGTQYRSAIFYHGAEQKAVAEKIMGQVEKSGAWKARLTTQVAEAKAFYPAEEYHQKYLVKHPGGYDNHFVRELSFIPKATPTPKP